PFARFYWQALIEAANGFLTAARSNPILDARYNGMVSAGAAIGSPQGIKDFTATRRNVVLAQIAAHQSTFSITSNGGADFTTNRRTKSSLTRSCTTRCLPTAVMSRFTTPQGRMRSICRVGD